MRTRTKASGSMGIFRCRSDTWTVSRSRTSSLNTVPTARGLRPQFPFLLVLDRVLDGDDVLLRGVELTKRCIQGGGLTAPRRSCDQDRPVRPAEDLFVHLVDFGGEAELGELDLGAGGLQEPQDHLLAVDRRQAGDAQV